MFDYGDNNYMQKYENQAVVVRPGEMRYWEALTVDDMSEESDDPEDPNTLAQKVCNDIIQPAIIFIMAMHNYGVVV